VISSTKWITIECKGIIDGDNATIEKVDKLEEKNIHVLPFNEIEMLLLSDEVMQSTMNNIFPEDAENRILKFKNEFWKRIKEQKNKLTVISAIKANAESSMIFYRDSIIETLNDSKKLIHSNQATVKLQEALQHHFKCYGMALYIHSYATFLDVVLGENYRADYLQNISEKIKTNVYQYRVDYTEVYNQLSDYANSSAQKKLLEGVGAFGKLTGKAVAKVPIVSKGLLDEALIAAGEKIEDFSEKHVDNVMEQFMENRDAGVQLFLDNIENINQMCNQKVDILFDNEVIYLTA